MVLYSLTLYLAFLTAGFPAGIMSLIWTEISEKMTVEVPYISLMRTMIAAGAVLACILCGRLHQSRGKLLDMCLAGVSLETLGVIGLSMSRLFWHLLIWTFVLGLGFGMSLTLLCVAIFRMGERAALFQFSGAGAGAFLGSWILSSSLTVSGSWRTGCQVLGIIQIFLAALAFLIRRVLMRKPELRRKLEERSRKEDLDRERQKMDRRPDAAVLRTAEKRYMKRIGLSCIASFLLFLLISGIILWPQSYRVVDTGASAGTTPYGILTGTIGLAAGCIFFGTAGLRRKHVFGLSAVSMGVFLLLEAYLLQREALSGYGILIFQVLEGAAAGPIFPELVLLDDIMLDREAETSLISLMPAFGLGAFAMVTPLTQALVGAGQTGRFPLWLLLITAALEGCIFFSLREGKE